MELGQYELQIFISLVVILAAALVALICDFLKGNNEQLRELAIELKVRREEEDKRPQTAAVREKVTEEVRPPVTRETTRDTTRETARETAREAAQALAVRKAVEERAAAMGAARQKPAALALPPAAVKTAPKIEAAANPPAKVAVPRKQVASAPKPPVGPRKDWQALLARSSVKMVPNATSRVTRVEKMAVKVSVKETSSGSTLPAGYHDSFALSRLLRGQQPISGLVVSIGVSGAHKVDGSMPEAVVQLIQSLMRPGEFGCSTGEDEFLLICPAERGGAAQRRLSLIAQRLWDFQLRSLGTFSILFSWGGLEVNGESIEEAVSAATERMQETRRGRKMLGPKLLSMEPRRLRAAV